MWKKLYEDKYRKSSFKFLLSSSQTIHPRLIYKGAALSKSNEFKYLGVTFDNKFNSKNHVDKIALRVSKRINVLKRLTGNKWECVRSTLNVTYQKNILPVITYSSESLVSAQPHTHTSSAGACSKPGPNTENWCSDNNSYCCDDFHNG